MDTRFRILIGAGLTASAAVGLMVFNAWAVSRLDRTSQHDALKAECVIQRGEDGAVFWWAVLRSNGDWNDRR